MTEAAARRHSESAWKRSAVGLRMELVARSETLAEVGSGPNPLSGKSSQRALRILGRILGQLQRSPWVGVGSRSRGVELAGRGKGARETHLRTRELWERACQVLQRNWMRGESRKRSERSHRVLRT